MTLSPRFSPDGQRIVMSLSQGASSNIFVMDLRSRSTTRLTDTNAIDTSPSYSPDGTQIVFESDRGGSQQIYVMGASGGGARRISFGEGRYSTPVWSPRGDYIAFTKQKGGTFAIGIMKPDGSGERILTERLPQRGPVLGAERPLPRLLPRRRRQFGSADVHGGRDRPGRAAGAGPLLRVRSVLVPVAELMVFPGRFRAPGPSRPRR